MVEFLSDEWIAALADACAGTPVDPDAGSEVLVVEPTVTGVPGRGEVRYRLTFDAHGCSVAARAAGAAAADVRLETDYLTAVGLARGEMNAQVALADGRLRVSGDVARMAAHASALVRLDDLFDSLRGTTSYPGAGVRS